MISDQNNLLENMPKESNAASIERSPRPHVCHVVSGDCWAGAEVQVATLIRSLCRSEKLRVSVIILNEGRLAAELKRAGARVLIIPESTVGFLSTLRTSISFLRQETVTIIHSHRYKENILAHLIAFLSHIPIRVRTVHGLTESTGAWLGARHLVLHLIDRVIGMIAGSVVVSVSAEMSPSLARQYGSHRVVTIPNGIDIQSVDSILTKRQAKLKIGCGTGPVVGYVGRIEAIKRLDLFLASASELSKQLPTAQFIVAGDGRLLDSMMALSRRLQIDAQTHFLGHRDDIHDVIRALDVMVICSDHEGMPMSVLEAMCLGTPIVGRAVGGVKLLLEDGKCGMCVHSDSPNELAKACLRLIQLPHIAEQVSGSAKESIGRLYSAESNANKVLDLYWRLMKE